MSTKEQYWKYSLITIIIGLGIILFLQITPFLGGLLGALTIYILVRRQMIHLTDKRKMKRSVAATLITTEAILFVLVFVLYFMLIGGQRMEKYISEILPFSEANTEHVVHDIKMLVHSNAVGIPLLAIIQGGVAMIGYWFFDVPDILLTGFLTCLATVIPMVGTALVWFPIAVYMALSGDLFNGIGLAIFGTLIISQLDNLIRFILQKKMADIHPLITIFGVVIGLSLFGFMGVIFGPLLLSLFFLFVDMFKREYLDGKKLD